MASLLLYYNNLSDITNVSGISSDVTTVSGISSDVTTTLSSNNANITTVAGSISNVNTVAGISSDVTTVAGISSDVTAVVADATDIGTVATNIANVNAVGSISANVTTVAGISSDVTAVAADATDIGTVATNIADVNTAADNITEIQNAPTNAATATTKAAEAATSATNAATSETNASTSATNAATSAGNASISAANSASSATSASNAQAAAEAARDSALASFDSFDDRYLGTKTSDPSVDNDGNALVAGALYFNTTSSAMKVYTGSAWVAAYVSGTDYLALSGGEMTGDLKYGDNIKAKFGAGDDLQIYHDGSHSYIAEGGDATGSLRIRGENLVLENNSGSDYLNAVTNAQVELFHNGSKKIETTSTGIDVTGTVTSSDANGVTLDGQLNAGGDSSARGELFYDYSAGDFTIENTWANDAGEIYLKANGANRVEVSGNGDISFYEDTGTTAKFFWDASAESLGIGTTPSGVKLDVAGTIRSTVSGGTPIMYLNNGTTQHSIENVSGALVFKEDAVEAARIDASGNLLVGTTDSTLYNNSGSGSGASLQADGQVHVARNGNTAVFNRLSTDGSIADFRKDGTTVGSINSDNGKLVVNSGGSNLVFAVGGTAELNLDGSQFYPQTDGGLDLGHPSVRWQNGRFSGTVDAANFNTTSDATLKTNVETLTGSLDAVKALRGVSFDWIENGNSEVGVIAQEVEAVVPDVVSTNDQGIKSVKYGNLVGVLIEAIKEQQAHALMSVRSQVRRLIIMPVRNTHGQLANGGTTAEHSYGGVTVVQLALKMAVDGD